MRDLLSDLRFAARSLSKRPGLVVLATLSLAIGIGATTAIFSAVNVLFLRPLPGIHHWDRAVEVGRTNDGRGFDTFGYPDFMDLRRDAAPLDQLALWSFGQWSLAVDGAGERIDGFYVSANYFETLGVRTTLGRTFLPDEDQGLGEHPVLVVSHGFWRDHLAADPNVIGKTVLLNRQPHTVVGVLDSEFRGHLIGPRSSVWVPLMQSPELVGRPELLTNRRMVSFAMLGRLAEGATVAEADVAVHTVMQRLAEEFPDSNSDRNAKVVPLGPVPGAGRIYVAGFTAMLMALVGVVLLLTCTNIAGMLGARGLAREREVAVRLALGCARGRLVRLMLAEAMLIAILGGALGSALSFLALRSLDLSSLPVPVTLEVDLGPDLRVLGFALLATTLAAALFGLFPALQATRPELVGAIRDSGARRGDSRHRLRQALVAAQVAMSLLLATSAGLFLRSLQHAAGVVTGFEAESVLMTSLDLSLEGYGDDNGRELIERIIERLEAVPGVRKAAFSVDLPLDMNARGTGIIPEGVDPDGPDPYVGVDLNQVTLGYFDTLGISLLRGRPFDATDHRQAPRVALVSRTFASQLSPDKEVLGQRFRYGERDADWTTVVGVVEDTKNQTIGETAKPFVYTYLEQDYADRGQLTVATGGDPPNGPPGMADAIRRAILEVDPSLSVPPVLSLASYTSLGTLPQRLAASITSALGVVALLLAGIGIYAAIAMSVAQRIREIGIRMALGEARVAVLRRVVAGAFRLVLPGLLAGAALSIAAGQLMAGFLIGTSPLDPLTLVLVAIAIGMVVTVASLAPARRASRIDPVVALRSE